MAFHPRVGFIGRVLPPIIRRESIAQLLAARRAAYQTRVPEWIDDPSDPASEVIDAVADLEWRVMQRFNAGAIQLSAATADSGNLDFLAGNVGLTRRQDEPDDTLRARVAAHLLSANIATIPALLAACLAQPGILDADSQDPENGQDFAVWVRSDTVAHPTAVADLQTWLNDVDRRLAGWSYTVTEAAVTRIYAAVDVTYNSFVHPLGDLRLEVERAVGEYFAGLGVRQAVHINRVVALAIGAGALNAVVRLGTVSPAAGTVDLPAVAGARYEVQDAAADIVYRYQDVI